MKRIALFTAAIASASMLAGPAVFAKPPASWDGLVQVKSKRLDLVYLQPGADLRGYTKVLIEPTEIAFAKNWQRDYNRGSRALSARVSDRDVQDAITKGVKAGVLMSALGRTFRMAERPGWAQIRHSFGQSDGNFPMIRVPI